MEVGHMEQRHLVLNRIDDTTHKNILPKLIESLKCQLPRRHCLVLGSLAQIQSKWNLAESS